MVHKAEQLRIKALITEAITVLCRDGLGYRTKFSVEGLLGITLDDDDIFLVSIRELVQKTEKGSLERQSQASLKAETAVSAAETVALVQAQGLLLQQQQQHVQQQQKHIQHQQQQHHEQQQQARAQTVAQQQQQPLERVLLPSITGPTIVMSAGPTGGGPLTPQILSPQTLPFRALSVDQLTSASALSHHRRTASLPHSQPSSDQISFVSTVDSALGSSLSSHSAQPSPQLVPRRRRANSDQSEPPPAKRAAPSTESSGADSVIGSGRGSRESSAAVVVVKHEPLSDSEHEVAPTTTRSAASSEAPCSVSTPAFSVCSLGSAAGCSSWPPSTSVTPVHTVTTPVTPITNSTQVSSGGRSQVSSQGNTNHHGHPSPRGGGGQQQAQVEAPTTVCALHRSLLEQSGCIVFASSVVLQDGTKTHTRTNGHLVQAMQEMTYPLGHPRHVGQYKEVMAGRYSRKVFYKCPPEIVRQEILAAYGITLKTYTKMFYSDVKPVTSSSKWFETVETLMLNFPYGPRLFPLQMMGLTEDQMRVLSMVRVYKENKQNHKTT